MPRPRPRRPLGAGSALTTLALLFIVGLVAAQQQQSFEHDVHNRSPPRVEKAHIIPPHHGKHHLKDTVGDADTRRPYTPLLSQNARAVATKVPSAPAISAVRAYPARYAASGGLVPSARSLHDWEVEDFVLLATIDGHIHARDRYNGEEIWELSGKPMLETIYNTSTGKSSPQDQPFVWIVEPREDGALYLLQPGPHPVLTHLGVTVKQLAESAPYSSDDPDLPVVYNVEKKTFMLLVEAASGIVKQSFSPGGPTLDDSCAPDSKNFFSARERDCRGVIDIGQTQYTITIHNKKTNEHICTIKYAEWNPNSRDKDLQSQYDQTLDKQYIYTLYSGEVIAFDYKRPRSHQRPLYRQHLPYPVARVFDVARPLNDPTDEPPLVLLPQPAGPAFTEDRYNHVLLNRTETGAWYALSEANYPAVTDGAPDATCYKQSETVTDWDANYAFPDVKTLVGVHKLDYRHPMQKTQLPGIAAPTYYDPVNDRVISNPPETSPRERQQPPTIDAPPQPHADVRFSTPLVFSLLLVLVVFFGLQAKPKVVESWKSYLMSHLPYGNAKEQLPPVPAPTEPESGSSQEKVLQLPDWEVEDLKQPVVETVEKAEVNVPAPVPEETKERKVTFDIPDDEEDLTPLSRATTVDRDSPVEDEAGNTEPTPPNGQASMTNSTDDLSQDTSASPATPKKKKTHRGRRGGRKLSKSQKEEDINRAVDAAKQLEVRPRLQPDELTETGGDVQAINEIKRIGKLTIDQDRLLGNGSGGTFVFEGKWKNTKVAIKRMLPQYFGLAEQEVKLLQNSDPHPNVIRYFDDEQDENFLYIAVELCHASLFDLYKDGRPDENLTEEQRLLVNKISTNAAACLYQLASGLNHLHHLRIIHRDIKPQNILLAQPHVSSKDDVRLVISDFGLCKTLPDNVSTLVGTTGNAGTVGWKAPELISQPKELANGSSQGFSRDSSSSTDPVAQGVKRAVDIFSLGCVFYYVLTGGSHPFDDGEGWMQLREYNIKKEKSNLEHLLLGADSVEPHHLIQWMLKPRPEERPTALAVMNHPFFWDAQKRLDFLCDCSDHWERESRDPPSQHLLILEEYGEDVIHENPKKRDFLAKLDQGFIASLGKQRKYTGDKMLDLLRALRNKKNHYEDMDEGIKAKVGSLPEGYLRYWTVKFPQLLMGCYSAVMQCDLESQPRFRKYFESAK